MVLRARGHQTRHSLLDAARLRQDTVGWLSPPPLLDEVRPGCEDGGGSRRVEVRGGRGHAGGLQGDALRLVRRRDVFVGATTARASIKDDTATARALA